MAAALVTSVMGAAAAIWYDREICLLWPDRGETTIGPSAIVRLEHGAAEPRRRLASGVERYGPLALNYERPGFTFSKGGMHVFHQNPNIADH
jgi:hypothetical protein